MVVSLRADELIPLFGGELGGGKLLKMISDRREITISNKDALAESARYRVGDLEFVSGDSVFVKLHFTKLSPADN